MSKAKEATEHVNDQADEEIKKRKGRSPNHPIIPLETAVEKTRLLFNKYHRQPASLLNACITMGYKTIYSTSNQTAAALGAYGLADFTGKGDGRKMFVTEIGERIVRGAPDRDQLLKNAALAPTIHREVFDNYDGTLPHDDILKDYLLWERPEGSRFTEDAVDAFISRLRETFKYAKLSRDDSESSAGDDNSEEDTWKNELDPDGSRGELKVGSKVQWTSQGVNQFAEPLPIARIDEHDGERFAYFEGKGHAPMSQLTAATSTPAKDPVVITPITPVRETALREMTPPQGSASDRMTLPEGAVLLSWPADLSAESVEELDYWLKGVMRRARRAAGLPPEAAISK